MTVIGRITGIEKKKPSFNITLDDSSGEITVAVQKSPSEDIPAKLREVSLE